ncbi:Uncharacterised protein [Providencia stuartii]|nr:Uncharacterised protein [Providencia stuartii]
MTQYAVRVELYNADYDDYDDLHKKNEWDINE